MFQQFHVIKMSKNTRRNFTCGIQSIETLFVLQQKTMSDDTFVMIFLTFLSLESL